MSKMASLLGRDVTERVFLDRFSQLCKNNTFYVRKACASHIGDFCSVIGKDAYEKILVGIRSTACRLFLTCRSFINNNISPRTLLLMTAIL